MPILTAKGNVIDTTLDQEKIARLIWAEGLMTQQAYLDLKQELGFDHLAVQVAGDLERARLLTQGTVLDYDDYHKQPWAPHAAFNTLIQGNQTLFKVTDNWQGPGLLQQFTNFSVRPRLRNGKHSYATHKLDLKTNTIIPYHGKRRHKPAASFDKTKKQSATFLSKNLQTAVFGGGGVGLLFDENKCDIRAMFKTNAVTVNRGWVGSHSTVQYYQNSMAQQLMTDRTQFRQYVDGAATSVGHNEVLAKFSIPSILGVFIAGDSSSRRAEARTRQRDLKAHFGIDYPIFIYDNSARTIRIYTQQEQADDAAPSVGYNKIARENQFALTTLQPVYQAIQAGDVNQLMQLFQKQPKLIQQCPWIFRAIDDKQPLVLNYLMGLQGIGLEKKNARQETALVYATRIGALQSVDMLLNGGANIDSQDADGQTALMHAIVKDDLQFLQLLLKHHPDHTIIDKMGDTAILLAIKNFNLDMVEILLTHGSDANQLDGHQQTALQVAIQYDFMDCITALLKHNADVDQVDANGDTALMHAVRNGNAAIVKLLLAHRANFKLKNNKGESAFTLAMNLGNSDILDLLIGVDIDNILIFAAQTGDDTLVAKTLTKRNVRVDFADDNQETAMMHAVYQNNFSIANRLYAAGADLKCTNKHQETALTLAVKLDHVPIVGLLLSKKADINHVDKTGHTPLMYAARQGNVSMVRLLLNQNPPPNLQLQNQQSETAFLLAVQNQQTAIVDLFLQHDRTWLDQMISNGQTGLMVAASQGDAGMVDFFLRHGADASLVDIQGNTALMLAAREGHLHAVKKLIPYTIDLDLENNLNETILTLAVVHQHPAVVTELLVNGCSVDQINGQGETPLMIASKQANGAEIVGILLQHGANATQQDINDEHALMHAAHGGDVATVKRLLAHHSYDLKHTNKLSQTVMDIAIDEQPDVLEALLLHAAELKDERELMLDKRSNQDLKEIFLDLFEKDNNDDLDGMMAFLLLDIYKMIHRFDPRHVDAIAAATALHTSLKKSFHDYRQTNRDEDDRNDLFDNWRAAIDEAKKSELSHHRHWSKNLLAHLSLFILTAGVGYLGVGFATLYKTGGKSFFFNTNTTSVNKLNAVVHNLNMQQAVRGA